MKKPKNIMVRHILPDGTKESPYQTTDANLDHIRALFGKQGIKVSRLYWFHPLGFRFHFRSFISSHNRKTAQKILIKAIVVVALLLGIVWSAIQIFEYFTSH